MKPIHFGETFSKYPPGIRAQCIQLVLEGKTHEQAGQAFNVPKATVTYWWRLDVRKKPFRPHPEALRLQAEAMFLEGLNIVQISKEIGIPTSTIGGWFTERQPRKRAKGSGVIAPAPYRTGYANWR